MDVYGSSIHKSQYLEAIKMSFSRQVDKGHKGNLNAY